MMNILLISNSLDNINIAWRHFRYREYDAVATTNIEAGMDRLRSDDAPKMVAFYCAEDTENFYAFYDMLRSDPKTSELPLLVLADVSWQRTLTEYFKFYNTHILGNSVNDEKLKDIVRLGLKFGFEEKTATLNRPVPKRPKKTQ